MHTSKLLNSSQQKIDRVNFILSIVDFGKRAQGGMRTFKDLKNVIMVDESWFYLMKNDHRVRLADDVECNICPTTRHKSHIEKIMFLSLDLRRLILEARQ
jgi:hypothetical protein